MITAGVDIGSSYCKALVLRDNAIADWCITPTTGDSAASADSVMALLLNKVGLSLKDIDYVVATGYGRVNVPFARKSVTEISCHARGAFWLFPNVRTILDIGGQDVKAIRCDDKGLIVKFVLNDKCAAGTGRYLERTAVTLGLKIAEIGPLALQSSKDPPPSISSICTVFAAEEMLRHMRKGEDKRDILAGATRALVERLRVLIDRVGLEEALIITGGVARNVAVVAQIERQLCVKAIRPPEPQIMGALGAALFAAREAKRILLRTAG